MNRKKLKEDAAPANVVGDGKVAGLGVGAQGEPPVNKKSRTLKIIRRVVKIK